MKHTRFIFTGALLIAMLFGASNAGAQDIPAEIPDTPGESPMDRERENREERHHAFMSRLFGTTSVTASPILTGPGFAFDTVLEGGMETGNGDALFFMIGARRATDDPAAPRIGSPVRQGEAEGEFFALGYEIGLKRFSSHEVLGRSTVSVSVGGFLADAGMLYVDVSPRYVIRANRYWSLPVGVTVTTSFLGTNADPLATVGITAGIRRHFGQRKSLK